ncbi:helix-turn-helix domain-containing protein [Bacillus carboniphilus]|uniref:Helix-turn-helix domain-containing protein n=1 Tax=Bacillus carboniphilus TaxID=86663 RepID=A0ABN0W5W0_9BACI
MKFEIVQPTKLLRPWIECYWNVQLDTGAKPKNEVILPNGKIEMIFALEGNYQVVNRRTHKMKHAWLSGIHHEPLEIHYNGKSNLIGIRFYPHGIFPFLHVPIQETVNQVENLYAVWDVFYEEIFETLCMLKGQKNTYIALDQLLLRKITERKTSHHQVLANIVEQIRMNPQQSIPKLAASIGFTQRHLNRLFKDHTGITPKLLSQIFRFEKAFSYLHSQSEEEVADIISTLGYYDQSHFNKEFKRFSGMTPLEYKQRAIESSNFL